MTDYEENPMVVAALAGKYDAEAEYFRQQARNQLAMADATELITSWRRRQDEFDHAADVFNQVYRLTNPNPQLPRGYIDGDAVELCEEHLSRWSRLHPGTPITLVLNSPGGSVTAGMYLFDYLEELKRQEHEITMHARGWCASMATILLQAASPRRRVMSKEATLLVHQPSAALVGTTGEIEDQKVYLDLINSRMLDIYAVRCAEAAGFGTATKPKTRQQLKTWWTKTDCIVDSGDALAFGLIDEIR